MGEGTPTIIDLSWSGNIRTSPFEIIYSYQNSSGSQTIAKGVYKYDAYLKRFDWKTYPQAYFNRMYLSKGMLDSFGQLHRFMYEDRYYYLTDAKVLNTEGNQTTTTNYLMLCDGSYTPLTLLPIELPSHLGQMSNFSAPSIQRLNSTTALISFRHNELNLATNMEEYSHFIYFVEIPGK